MPNRDRTGPSGEGPRSGYSAGDCNGEGRFGKRGLGRGRGGRGFRRGRGFGQGSNRGNSWVAEQLNALQSAIQKLTAKVDEMNE